MGHGVIIDDSLVCQSHQTYPLLIKSPDAGAYGPVSKGGNLLLLLV